MRSTASTPAFARVVSGMDVVQAIDAAPVNGERPVEPILIERVRIDGGSQSHAGPRRAVADGVSGASPLTVVIYIGSMRPWHVPCPPPLRSSSTPSTGAPPRLRHHRGHRPAERHCLSDPPAPRAGPARLLALGSREARPAGAAAAAPGPRLDQGWRRAGAGSARALSDAGRRGGAREIGQGLSHDPTRPAARPRAFRLGAHPRRQLAAPAWTTAPNGAANGMPRSCMQWRRAPPTTSRDPAPAGRSATPSGPSIDAAWLRRQFTRDGLLVADVRRGIRALRAAPGFTALVLFVLSVALAAGTVVFSVVDTVVLRRLPFPEPDRLVSDLRAVERRLQASRVRRRGTTSTGPRANGRSRPGAAGARPDPARRGHRHERPSWPSGCRRACFTVLAVAPGRGRLHYRGRNARTTTTSRSSATGSGPVDSAAIPPSSVSTLALSGETDDIFGVMPAAFDIRRLGGPRRRLDSVRRPPAIARAREGVSKYLEVIGRLEPGVTMRAARADLERINQRSPPIPPAVRGLEFAGARSPRPCSARCEDGCSCCWGRPVRCC